jgi:hypothetical protein
VGRWRKDGRVAGWSWSEVGLGLEGAGLTRR